MEYKVQGKTLQFVLAVQENDQNTMLNFIGRSKDDSQKVQNAYAGLLNGVFGPGGPQSVPGSTDRLVKALTGTCSGPFRSLLSALGLRSNGQPKYLVLVAVEKCFHSDFVKYLFFAPQCIAPSNDAGRKVDAKQCALAAPGVEYRGRNAAFHFALSTRSTHRSDLIATSTILRSRQCI